MLWTTLQPYIGRIVGVLAGLLFGVIYIFVGLLNTIVIMIFVSAGFYFGRKIDQRESLIEVLDRILPGKFTRL